MTPAPARAVRRIALYSHDTQGLGHVRRNLALAAALLAAEPGTDVLVLTGAAEATTLPLPPRTEVLTLPALQKDLDGRYAPRTLSGTLPELLALRARILEAALTGFAPDLLVVDKVARGVHGELDGALAALRAAGRTRLVLGLREVLDEPEVVAREWRAARTTEAVRDLYDAVWVYGDRSVYDPVEEYGLPASVRRKVAYTGYLAQGRGEGARSRTRPAPRGAVPEGPFVLCLVGGGQDGSALAEAFCRAEAPPGHGRVLVTGPYMHRDARAALRRLAAGRDDLRVLGFVPDLDAFVATAAAVVSMAGYNTVCELLAARRRALLVPRTAPRREQLLRAKRLCALGAVDLLEPESARPERLSAWLAAAVAAGPRAPAPVDLDGLRAVPELAARLLSVPAPALPALVPAPSAPARPVLEEELDRVAV